MAELAGGLRPVAPENEHGCSNIRSRVAAQVGSVTGCPPKCAGKRLDWRKGVAKGIYSLGIAHKDKFLWKSYQQKYQLAISLAVQIRPWVASVRTPTMNASYQLNGDDALGSPRTVSIPHGAQHAVMV
jgi:hypothetical protein